MYFRYYPILLTEALPYSFVFLKYSVEKVNFVVWNNQSCIDENGYGL